MKYTFSGHESFQCKNLWLKKGYDFVDLGMNFTDDNSVVLLGVGRNMVSSIKYWLKSFNIIDEKGLPTDIASQLLSDERGYDPYLENIGSLWLLHYLLLKQQNASIYYLTFADCQKERSEFTKEQLFGFLKRKYAESGNSQALNEKTVMTDIGVLLKNYVKPDSKSKTFEDYSVLLLDLNLLIQTNSNTYQFNYTNKEIIPSEIFLYAILDKFKGDVAIDYNEILDFSRWFCLLPNETLALIKEISEKYKGIVYTEDAGIKQIHIKENIDKWQVLLNYYDKFSSNITE